MLKLIIRQLRCGFGTRKMKSSDSVPSHPPTTDLWQIGDGVVDKNQIVVSGWNVNGYRSIINKGSLNNFLQKVKPDWLCLNETKIDYQSYQTSIQHSSQNVEVVSYYQYWNFCKISKGYSGVSILTPFKPLRVVQDIPEQPNHSLQGRMLTLQYQKFYLVNVYKPNVGRTLQRMDYRTKQYDLAFNSYVKQLMQKKNVIIFGDMNVAHEPIDLANPRSNNGKPGFTLKERINFTNLLNLNLNDTFRMLHPQKEEYTYWSNLKNCRQRNIGWRIDYILASQDLKVEDATIHSQEYGSDHCPISAKIIL